MLGFLILGDFGLFAFCFLHRPKPELNENAEIKEYGTLWDNGFLNISEALKHVMWPELLVTYLMREPTMY